jgi:hypothetical protein
MISWDQSENGDLEPEDGLDFALSADGGVTWSNNIQAFRDDIGSSMVKYFYMLTNQYLTQNFRIRFQLVGCADGSGNNTETVYIDNIAIAQHASRYGGNL